MDPNQLLYLEHTPVNCANPFIAAQDHVLHSSTPSTNISIPSTTSQDPTYKLNITLKQLTITYTPQGSQIITHNKAVLLTNFQKCKPPYSNATLPYKQNNPVSSMCTHKHQIHSLIVLSYSLSLDCRNLK
eukprot:8347129-Ditylum_brightwellii.AAC.1